MKSLFKITLIIGAFFTSMMLIFKVTGILDFEQIKALLNYAQGLSLHYVFWIVVCLLALDLVIAVPTLSISLLSAYFLGFWGGFTSSLLGTSIAGFTGYILSRKWGEKVFSFILKGQTERDEMYKAFQKHGFLMIILSRGAPVLAEVSACLGGLTRMKITYFSLAWFTSSVPYLLISSYAGSISSINSPMPAIYAFIGLSGTLWLSWYFILRKKLKPSSAS